MISNHFQGHIRSLTPPPRSGSVFSQGRHVFECNADMLMVSAAYIIHKQETADRTNVQTKFTCKWWRCALHPIDIPKYPVLTHYRNNRISWQMVSNSYVMNNVSNGCIIIKPKHGYWIIWQPEWKLKYIINIFSMELGKFSWIVHINKWTSFEAYRSADVSYNIQYTRGPYYSKLVMLNPCQLTSNIKPGFWLAANQKLYQ